MKWTCKYCESINEGNKCFYCGAPREKPFNKNNENISQLDILEITETSYHFCCGEFDDVIWLKNVDGTLKEINNSDGTIKENENGLQECKNSNSDHKWHRIQKWFSRFK